MKQTDWIIVGVSAVLAIALGAVFATQAPQPTPLPKPISVPTADVTPPQGAVVMANALPSSGGGAGGGGFGAASSGRSGGFGAAQRGAPAMGRGPAASGGGGGGFSVSNDRASAEGGK